MRPAYSNLKRVVVIPVNTDSSYSTFSQILDVNFDLMNKSVRYELIVQGNNNSSLQKSFLTKVQAYHKRIVLQSVKFHQVTVVDSLLFPLHHMDCDDSHVLLDNILFEAETEILLKIGFLSLILNNIENRRHFYRQITSKDIDNKKSGKIVFANFDKAFLLCSPYSKLKQFKFQALGTASTVDIKDFKALIRCTNFCDTLHTIYIGANSIDESELSTFLSPNPKTQYGLLSIQFCSSIETSNIFKLTEYVRSNIQVTIHLNRVISNHSKFLGLFKNKSNLFAIAPSHIQRSDLIKQKEKFLVDQYKQFGCRFDSVFTLT